MASFLKPTGPPPGKTAQAADAAPPVGAYLTNGCELFRVQSIVSGILAELEDCMTLELLVCPLKRTARMRVVNIGRDLAAQSSSCASVS